MRIRFLRNLLRLSQEFVGEQLGIGQTGYSKIENGQVELRHSQVAVLADLFRARVEELYLPFYAETAGPAQPDFFRPSDKQLRDPDPELSEAIARAAGELFVWAQDGGNKHELQTRSKRAKETRGEHRTVLEATEAYRKRIKSYAKGLLVDVYELAMREFGLWVGWNSFSPYAGFYLAQGTELSGGETLVLPLVGIHTGHSIDAQRWTLAHHIGHHLLGHNVKAGCMPRPGSDPMEQEADDFAVEILMRPSLVQTTLARVERAQTSMKDYCDVVYLTAMHLQVSYRALAARLIALGLASAEQREDLRARKTRDLRREFRERTDYAPLTEKTFKDSEADLRKTKFYRTAGDAPWAAQDLRFLQDYCYLRYLKTTKFGLPMPPRMLFEEVARKVFQRYPKYTA